MYDLLVFIGRFQPFHEGHKTVVDKALSLANTVLILVGTNSEGRTLRNPWTFQERLRMIRSVYPDEKTLLIGSATDQPTDEAWVEHVNASIAHIAEVKGAKSVGLIGCNKDHTSYYLEMFPGLKSEAVHFVSPLNATDIREMLWEKRVMQHEIIGSVLNKNVADIVFRDDMGMESVEVAESLRAKHLENIGFFNE
jgi:bifunctional NMN adenylyltransferase/nudix hydrolase